MTQNLTPEEAAAEIKAMDCDEDGVPNLRPGETIDQMLERLGEEQDGEDQAAEAYWAAKGVQPPEASQEAVESAMARVRTAAENLDG